MSQPVIKQSGNDYAIITPYNQAFVNELKVSLPIGTRSFDREQKAWIVTAQFVEMAAQIVHEYFGVKPEIPNLVEVSASQKYGFQLDYVGIPKAREVGKPNTAMGLSKGQWRIVFTEAVLRNWFEQAQSPSKEETLFSLLLIPETAEDSEIKSGYRRLARQWHPDVNHEPEAGEMFKKINNAYLILSDPLKRKRYEAGLSFERESNRASDYRKPKPEYFIPPLRCGNLMATGELRVGKLHVTEILQWDDVTNEQGQTMVSSWNKAKEAVDIEWV
jgi:hypothetical protein